MSEHDDLDGEIDELATDIELLIKQGKKINEKFDGQFDHKYRRMEEAKATNESLFA